MTLLDVTMATAARSVDLEMGVVTIEMKTSFMQPCRGPLTGKGRLMHRTASRWPSPKARIYDAAGQGLRACHRHLQVRGAQPRAPQARFPPTDTAPRRHHAENKQILLDNRPRAKPRPATSSW
jgi:hypothetical protein